MRSTPISLPCAHIPSLEERDRDPRYLGCFALPGEPCDWARRSDAQIDPAFHSERIEAAARNPAVSHGVPLPDHDFEQDILSTGLI